MIEANRFAPFAVNHEPGGLADVERPAHHRADVHGQIRARLQCISDLDQRAVGGLDHAAVADLPARLAIEGRLGGDDLRRLAGANLAAFLAVDQQRGDRGLVLVDAVADEARYRGAADAASVARRLARLARAPALLLHAGVEACVVDVDVRVAQDVLGHVEREAVGVVELEGDVAGQRGLALRLQRVALLREQRETAVERLGEAFLLAAYDLFDVAAALAELGIGVTHDRLYRPDHLPQKRLGEAEAASV